MSDSKESRLNYIRKLLITKELSNQEEVVQELSKGGYDVTQSSVSRDLAEIGVGKSRGRYVLKATTEVRSLGLLSARAAGPNLLVLKTMIGAAQAVAYKLDFLNLNQIIGTVAGDDTIFVATMSSEDQVVILNAIGLDL